MRDIDQPLGSKSPEPAKRIKLFFRRIVLSLIFVVLSTGVCGFLFFKNFNLMTFTFLEEKDYSKPVSFSDSRRSLENERALKNNKVSDFSETSVGSDSYLSHLPDKDCIEESLKGLLPIVAKDGRRPFDVYSRPHSISLGSKIAVVIGGLGLSQTGTLKAIEILPADVTFAFAPQAYSLGRWMEKARKKGHEFVIQVPLEPFDYPNINPGHNTLRVDAKTADMLNHFESILSRTTNYIGIMNYMGARFMGDHRSMNLIMEELGRRGLFFLDDGTAPQSMASEYASKKNVPFAKGDIVIDVIPEKSAILKKLEDLEALAKSKGFAVAIGSAFDETLDVVSQWIQDVSDRNIEIVPISSLAKDFKDNMPLQE